MTAVFTYQVALIHRMQSINRDLSRINFLAARRSLEMMRDRDLVEEYTRKSFALADPDYISRLRESQEDFAASLRDMKSLGRTAKEQAEIDRLSQFWNAFTEDLVREAQALRAGNSSDIPPTLAKHLDRLRAQTYTVYQSATRAIEGEVERSAETGRHAEWISWSAAAVALVLSCLVSLLIVRSISEPLRYLTQGTRAITEGKFFYRLDTSRNDEFSQLARDFNMMTERLNELDQLKKDFVSHVSHELKAPLASMRETIHLLLEQIPGPLTEKQTRLLELSLQSGQRLSAMISNLLDLSRMEAGVLEYELKSQDLAALVRTAVAEFETQVREKALCLEKELPKDPLDVECDWDRILQVLTNLLGNALKFSPDGGVIGVRARCVNHTPEKMPEAWRQKISQAAHDGQFALVEVFDSGPGVPDEHKERIFEKFHQVKQSKKLVGQGVGLGLAICRTIVEAHRGALWVEDNPRGGSVFVLLLRAGGGEGGASYRASSPI